MNRVRRKVLKSLSAAGVATLGGMSLPSTSLRAAEWNKTGFSARAVPEALKSIGASSAAESKDILIKAPDIAENGAVVPIEVASRIANTQAIYILADKNPFPLIASFDFSAGGEGFASTTVKMGQTTDVRAVVKADGKYFFARREVKVTIGGCGG